MFDVNKSLMEDGKINGFKAMRLQRKLDIENAIRYFIHLYEDDVVINDIDIIQQVLNRYNLEDASSQELNYIVKEVNKAI